MQVAAVVEALCFKFQYVVGEEAAIVVNDWAFDAQGFAAADG